MKTLVSAPHLSARVRDTAETKLSSLTKYFERIESLRALLEREGDLHRVELVAHVGHGATLVIDARAETLEAALDEALQRMKSVLTRHKQRLVQRSRRSKRELE